MYNFENLTKNTSTLQTYCTSIRLRYENVKIVWSADNVSVDCCIVLLTHVTWEGSAITSGYVACLTQSYVVHQSHASARVSFTVVSLLCGGRNPLGLKVNNSKVIINKSDQFINKSIKYQLQNVLYWNKLKVNKTKAYLSI